MSAGPLSLRILLGPEKFGIIVVSIVVAIMGGAIGPPLRGCIAGVSSMRVGFALPPVCFVFIALYGMVCLKLEDKDRA